MDSQSKIIIRPFRADDQRDVKNLILAGMEEHWGVLDVSMNPDLNDIETNYKDNYFLVACVENRIVGSGALVTKSPQIAEIVRMSVAATDRRKGVGWLILDALREQANHMGIKKIVLETTELWIEVIAFYKNYGFEITHRSNGDIYFSLDIG